MNWEEMLPYLRGLTMVRRDEGPYFDSIMQSSRMPPHIEHSPTHECKVEGLHLMKDCPLATKNGYNK